MRLNQVIGYAVMVIGTLAFLYFGYLFFHDLIIEQAVITDTHYYFNYTSQVEVQGVVQNTGSLTIKDVWVRATLYDEKGNQVNSIAAPVQSDRLLPDGSASFLFAVDDPFLQTAGIQIAVDAAQIDLINWQ